MKTPEQPREHCLRSTERLGERGTCLIALAKSHRAWLTGEGARGHQRRDTIMRRVQPSYGRDSPADYPPGWLNEYCERWDLLRAAVAPE